jgi:methionyl aminopeptidase
MNKSAIGLLQESLFSELLEVLKPRVVLYEINDYVLDYFDKNNIDVIPETSPLTINVNNIVYHGQPSSYILKEGDLVTIDICFLWNKKIIDGAKTFAIGCISSNLERLIKINRESISQCLDIIDVGIPLKKILKKLSDFVLDSGFYLYPCGMGHGIGDKLHVRPFLSLTDYSDFDYIFKKGDIFTIEPVIFLHEDEVVENILGEGEIGVNNISSQFEVSIHIRDKGSVEILNIGLLN